MCGLVVEMMIANQVYIALWSSMVSYERVRGKNGIPNFLMALEGEWFVLQGSSKYSLLSKFEKISSF